jgi:predicted amidohydrolase YtcJ
MRQTKIMNRHHYRHTATFILLLAANWLLGGVDLKTANAQKPEIADTVLTNAKVLCCNPEMSIAQAIAIRSGRILAVGDRSSMEIHVNDSTKIVDLAGGVVTPGFCDSHLHFSGLGESLQRIDLRTAKTWDEVVDMVAEQAKSTPAGTWIEGRGWHQSKWSPKPEPNVEGYPLHDLLSQKVPDHPVVLTHASGHACLANAAAMKLAGIVAETENPDGGEIVRDAQGNAIGVFRENAQRLIFAARARDSLGTSDVAASLLQLEKAIQLAGQECLRYGITSVHDAGSIFAMAGEFGKFADQGKLPVRVYMMIREGSGSLLQKLPKEPIVDRGNGFFTARSVKVSIDGALGPHGAWLLEPYDDLPSSVGLNTVAMDELEKIAELCKRRHWQLCVHAIGDRANRETLNVFEKVLGSEISSDHRWRIEHAQHIHPNDLPRFASSGVIPVMQGNHCTSDALFVIERLGQRRASEGAYPWRTLIDSGCIIPNGTDAPVELVDPRVSLFASVTRQQPNGVAFFPEQCMTRREALLSYTLWPAIASFQDKNLGSITPGKLADLAIWDTNLLECAPQQLLAAKVLSTWVAGKQVYTSK